MQAEFRKLPAVDTLLRMPEIASLVEAHGQTTITALVRALLEEQRAAIRDGASAPNPQSWPTRIESALAQWMPATLVPVINATGVIVHTNLGRAPLSRAARAAVDAVACGYSNLEYDLEAGARGSRHEHARTRLCRVTGAEDALIVNNNAAALLLALAGLCADKEVIISRGQLVEIGGGFRIPDVLRQGGAQLVEVGTTNRTHVQDFRNALTDRTAAVLRVHSSNFKQIGFVSEPRLVELAQLIATVNQELSHAGQRAPVILIDDLGSGTFLDTARFGLAPEPMVQTSVASGADVVTFSGDKLLGGPQAGIIVGRKQWIDVLRRHPLARALRVDKMTLAALEATLAAYEQGRAVEEIPVWQMIGASVDELRLRAKKWRAALLGKSDESEMTASDLSDCDLSGRDVAGAPKMAIWETESAVGGGSLPGATLPSVGLALQGQSPTALAARLRAQTPPLIGRIQQDALVLDVRTVLPEQDALVPDLIRQAWTAQ